MVAQLADTVLLQADVTANSAGDKAFLQRFGLFGFDPPEKFLASLGAVSRY